MHGTMRSANMPELLCIDYVCGGFTLVDRPGPGSDLLVSMQLAFGCC